ncbi:hypothetical protein LCM20_07720 [Halobacillus litoralis]|uniref:hypothetical protein n=1 Tax=Halobacillus litoralis TaxID=45668 RepID=UPI001CD8005B|nr:hypothetical protein [Halobacillus litoralis]MCA0970469.1 hypothetical protein [Halobacillus litoralis]
MKKNSMIVLFMLLFSVMGCQEEASYQPDVKETLKEHHTDQNIEVLETKVTAEGKETLLDVTKKNIQIPYAGEPTEDKMDVTARLRIFENELGEVSTEFIDITLDSAGDALSFHQESLGKDEDRSRTFTQYFTVNQEERSYSIAAYLSITAVSAEDIIVDVDM